MCSYFDFINYLRFVAYLQGSANPQTLGSKSKKMKSCILLPAAGRRTQLFQLIFTEPWVCRFADPCTHFSKPSCCRGPSGRGVWTYSFTSFCSGSTISSSLQSPLAESSRPSSAAAEEVTPPLIGFPMRTKARPSSVRPQSAAIQPTHSPPLGLSAHSCPDRQRHNKWDFFPRKGKEGRGSKRVETAAWSQLRNKQKRTLSTTLEKLHNNADKIAACCPWPCVRI